MLTKKNKKWGEHLICHFCPVKISEYLAMFLYQWEINREELFNMKLIQLVFLASS